MKFLEFVLKYRFRYLDMLWIIISIHLFGEGMLFHGLAVFFGGLAIVITVEALLQKKNQKEEIQDKDHEWKSLADSAQMVAAIQRHRTIYGSSLMEARKAVFSYLGRPV